MKITRKRYIQAFLVVVLVLGWTKELCHVGQKAPEADAVVAEETDSVVVATLDVQPAENADSVEEDDFVPHRIYSVANFKNAFPDQNDVQLIAAEKHGIKPLTNRDEVKNCLDKLVLVSSNPYYNVDKMRNSIPYLVPKAASLLQDIGQTFFDSLQVKGIPLHKIIVTSVLRTDEDVEKLQRRNLNAAEKSCHQYATTVDICYNRYVTVEAPDGPARREVRNDSLKWVLSEVLNDMRNQNRCYVKYEVKQGCFHLTVR